ncbi:hypothetical protein V7S43_015431 [Phytophthora oleae]|uniref:Uncharacterized protein n=1 Tax=Phytophthora oleae TaxID=2107226 RepID=A0ABD3F1T9_9STRA
MPAIDAFSPVCVSTPDGFSYGQLTGVPARGYEVRCGLVTTTYPRRAVFAIPPAVCFLLAADVPRFAGSTRRAVEEHQGRIQDRRLGQNGSRATRNIKAVLTGIIPPSEHPTAQSTVAWRNHDSDEDLQVPPRHVIDFVHFVDGGKTVPPSLRAKIGDVFYREPLPAAVRQRLPRFQNGDRPAAPVLPGRRTDAVTDPERPTDNTSTRGTLDDLLVAITAPGHPGKPPTEFVEYVLASGAVHFQPHPAIISRLYAFEFGVRGLSILHLNRSDFLARRKWQKSRRVNM